jgi:hypothetical protein
MNIMGIPRAGGTGIELNLLKEASGFERYESEISISAGE